MFIIIDNKLYYGHINYSTLECIVTNALDECIGQQLNVLDEKVVFCFNEKCILLKAIPFWFTEKPCFNVIVYSFLSHHVNCSDSMSSYEIERRDIFGFNYIS